MMDFETDTLDKCAFRTDAENELDAYECGCPKITMGLYHQGHYGYVRVCRNYYAELFNRHYHELKERNGFYDVFDAACCSKMEILEELYGGHISGSLHADNFMKLNKNIEFYKYHVDKQYSFHHLAHKSFYMPILYARIDDKSAAIYKCEDVFSFICQAGIKDAVKAFGQTYVVKEIIRDTIEQLAQGVEAEGIKYKKKLVNPVLCSIKNSFHQEEELEMRTITALAELLDAMAKGKLTR